jgi:hypothetical protein
VEGNVKIVDGTQGTGKVLTSDSNGLARWQSTAHFIGEHYCGGIVFYVDSSGQHGLIASTTDQSYGMRWYAGAVTSPMALADGFGAGKANTIIIIANQGIGDRDTYAARVCNEYSLTDGGTTYGDWYLPSKYELNLLYFQRGVVGGFTLNSYWSSTEVFGANSNTDAWSQRFSDGTQNKYTKLTQFCIRAIRAF